MTSCRSFLMMKPSSSIRAGFSGSTSASCSVPFSRWRGRHSYIRSGLAWMVCSTCGDKADSFNGSYDSSKIFVYQGTVQRNHPVFCPGLDVRLDTEGLIVANERGDGRRIDHDLKDRDTAGLVNARDQQLRDDRLHDRGELDADLLLLIGGKGIHHAVNRFGRACSVERPENQVPGFRRGNG